jgi:hypothetical protein
MSDPCEPLLDEIAILNINLVNFQDQLKSATRSESRTLLAQNRDLQA